MCRSSLNFARHFVLSTTGLDGLIESGMKLAGSEGEVDNIGDCGNKYR